MGVRTSRIRGAGMGLFALRALGRGYTLPEAYKGRRLSEEQVRRLRDGSYLFQLRGNVKGCAGIDGKHTLQDNPLRYVNGARTAEQLRRVNVKSKQRGGNIYYTTTRRVAAGEELLINYGPEYFEGARYHQRAKELRKEMRQTKA